MGRPPSPGTKDPATPIQLTDVGSHQQLLSYAAIAQVTYMGSGSLGQGVKLSQSEIARRLPPTKAGPGRPLTGDSDSQKKSAQSSIVNKLKKPSTEFLRALDTVILTAAPSMGRAGGLAAFAARLAGERSVKNLEANIGALYRPWLLLETKPTQPIIVLLQASALLSALGHAEKEPYQVVNEHREALKHVVEGLIRIGVLPPTPYSVDALILLGSISGYAFELVQEALQDALRTPMGFRLWRAVTAVVIATRKRKQDDTEEGRRLGGWVKQQFDEVDHLRENSLYPGRSLDLELAISIPASWSRPGADDWANDVLRERAKNPAATLRERGTAAFGLWERAIEGGYEKEAERELRQLVQAFMNESGGRPGLSWIAKTLNQNVTEGKAILTHWEDYDEPCQVIIRDACQKLDSLPPRIQEATKTLFAHAVIKNAGVYRRRAIDTLRSGGWAAAVVPALNAVLQDPRAEPWLRTRTLFALGFLQERGADAQTALLEGCRQAWEQIKLHGLDDTQASRVRVIELHAAFFAIGDCFGDPVAKDVEQLRRRLGGKQGGKQGVKEEVIEWLETSSDRDHLRPVARALAYMIAVTTHTESLAKRSVPLLQRLRKLSTRDELNDPSTYGISSWGLQRITSSNEVLPMHNVPLPPLELDA